MEYEFIDTHAHLYLKAFKNDLEAVMARASANGVTRIFLPNLDSASIDEMHKICSQYEGICFPMMGLHPTSVKENYQDELAIIREKTDNNRYIAIGEIGIDLYWDKTYLEQQRDAFRTQLRWAKQQSLPVVIHARDSFEEIFEIMDQEHAPGLTGVFHSFTGNMDQLRKILAYGFYVGINGIVTFKNAGLEEVVKEIPEDRLLIETDAPYLAPVPYRGKRNESSYVTEVAGKIAQIIDRNIAGVASLTTKNALNLFKKAVTE
ncbi:MAG: TatD family hydrolase [Bacteroidales bacterium]